ncbi:MAG: UDP-N-acetylmuramoyl-L-alanyl-D-glutamate--2,6-diaminopimelate ligase [Lachnospiraceae bacterium]|nr:UDP-N-acetylmuramoyl-L-alanyl-D-glutamate--2,6-diaminopimelate ligase [Lachnospiraceae bacterium]
MKLSSLLEGLDYDILSGAPDTEIKMIRNDSRKVEKGDLFFCIKGAVSDGHTYAPQVLEKGAAAIIVEDEIEADNYDCTVVRVKDSRYAMGMISSAYYGHPSKSLKIIGITGTKGKTTTTYMIKDMLDKAGIKTGLIGTIEIITGSETIHAEHTTPESTELHKYLADMVESGMDACVMEVSSQGLMLDRVAGVDFDYGIFTNLSEDHIGPNEHKSFDEYMGWKAKLFTLVKTGIFNIDDEHAENMTEYASCDIVSFGVSEDADYRADNIRLYNKGGVLGTEFDLKGKMSGDIIVDLPGHFSVMNSLAAIAIASEMGVAKDVIADILKTIKVRGRVEMIPISDAFTLLIDYAHNGVALESLLTSLADYKPTRIVCLFGCGGNRAKDRRYTMGEASGKFADLSIITSDNPRNEDPQAIIDDIKVGIAKTDGEYVEIIDRKEAIRYAIMNAKEGDLIVLAGKGHEDYQEIKGVKHHMDERDLIREILEEEDVTKICGYNNQYFA